MYSSIASSLGARLSLTWSQHTSTIVLGGTCSCQEVSRGVSPTLLRLAISTWRGCAISTFTTSKVSVFGAVGSTGMAAVIRGDVRNARPACVPPPHGYVRWITHGVAARRALLPPLPMAVCALLNLRARVLPPPLCAARCARRGARGGAACPCSLRRFTQQSTTRYEPCPPSARDDIRSAALSKLS